MAHEVVPDGAGARTQGVDLASYSLDELAGGPAARRAGIKILEVQPGQARICMDVTNDMLNAYGNCHGGYVFLLADTALGVAANAKAAVSVAAHASIDYLIGVGPGVRVYATAQEVTRYGGGQRSALYDVYVEDESGALCATLRGMTRTVSPTRAAHDLM